MIGCIDHGFAGDRDGYRIVLVDGRWRRQHALVLEAHSGELANGRHARHLCHNPRCINPEHLQWGTHSDNMRDKQQAGRAVKGQASGQAKLTDVQVWDIFYSTDSYTKLAQQYGVSKATIAHIHQRRKWTHVTNGTRPALPAQT